MTGGSVTVTAKDLAGFSAVVNLNYQIIDQAYRNSLVPGQQPVNPDTCGLIQGIQRETVPSLTVQAGQTYSNLTIQNLINPPNVAGAAAAKFYNCDVQGPDTVPTSADSLVRSWGANHVPLEFYDSRLKSRRPDMARDGIKGHHFKLWRTEVCEVIDGAQIFNSNDPDGPAGVDIQGSWFHDHAYWPNPPDTSHTDGSHPDGIQIAGGANILIKYNRFDGFVGPAYAPTMNGGNQINAALMIAPSTGNITGLQVIGNDIDGGAFSINIANYSPRTLTNLGQINSNRFGRNQRVAGTTISMPSNVVCETIGNVWTDTGQPVTVKRNG
jgi:hypothetical protein